MDIDVSTILAFALVISTAANVLMATEKDPDPPPEPDPDDSNPPS